jgi:hypothetical protein
MFRTGQQATDEQQWRCQSGSGNRRMLWLRKQSTAEGLSIRPRRLFDGHLLAAAKREGAK